MDLLQPCVHWIVNFCDSYSSVVALAPMLIVTRFFWRQVPVFLFLGCALGVAVRLTVQDSVLAVAPIFYATPPMVLGAMALFAGLLWLWGGRRRLCGAMLLLSVMFFAWHGAISWFENEQTRPIDALRVVFWNTARGDFGFDGVVNALREADADVIGIVEAGEYDTETRDQWCKAFPDYAVSRATAGILLLCRGEINEERNGVLGYHSLYKTALLKSRGMTIRVFDVDICSSPVLDRSTVLAALAEKVATHENEPTLVMGDFNTPGDSVHFNPLRDACRNAFEVAGRGYAPTWPGPLACIQIDHVWVNNAIELSNCRHGWSWHSDHRPIILELRLQNAKTPHIALGK